MNIQSTPQNPWGCNSRLCLLTGVLATSAAMFMVLLTSGPGLHRSAPLGADLIPGDPVSSCGTISSPGTYTLGADLSAPGTCITIEADGVTLDGNNHTLTYNTENSGQAGIQINGTLEYPNRNSIIIENFAGINDAGTNGGMFIAGIYSNGGDTSALNLISILNNTFNSPYSTSIQFLCGTNAASITGNTITTGSAGCNDANYYCSGIVMNGSNGDTIEDNIITAYGHGVYFGNTPSTLTLLANTVTSNTGQMGSFYDYYDASLAAEYVPTFSSYTWTGAVNTEWNTAGNWAEGFVPVIYADVVIPVTENNPLITAGLENGVDQLSNPSLQLGTVTVDAGATLSSQSNLFFNAMYGELQLWGGGVYINDGTYYGPVTTYSSSIRGGTFYEAVVMDHLDGSYGFIGGGTFYGQVRSPNFIYAGTYYGPVVNTGSDPWGIWGGTFNTIVDSTNGWLDVGGTLTYLVLSGTGTISMGENTLTIASENTLDLSQGLTISGAVTNNGTITEATSCPNGKVLLTNGLTVPEDPLSPYDMCVIPVCGNGVKTEAEACDDGNTTAGDGCNATCAAIESGYACASPGEACTTVCGDSLFAGEETCDDGNTTAGDGCNATCLVETGYTCSGVGAGSCTANVTGGVSASSPVINSLRSLWNTVINAVTGGEGSPSAPRPAATDVPTPPAPVEVSAPAVPTEAPVSPSAVVLPIVAPVSAAKSTLKPQELLNLVTSGIHSADSIASKITLSPDKPVSRVQAVQVILERLKIAPDARTANIINPVRRALVTAQRLGILRGDANTGKLFPDRAVTNTELKIMLERAKRLNVKR